MLLRTLHFPSAYQYGQGVRAGSHLAIIRLLRSLMNGDLFLSDEDEVLLGSISSAISSWPDDAARKAAGELLIRFKMENRVARMKTTGPRSTRCRVAGCDLATDLGRTYRDKVDVVIATNNCECGRNVAIAFDGQTVFPDLFDPRHPLALRLKHSESVVVDDDESIDGLDNRLWHPLFCSSRWIELYDRNLGRSIYKDILDPKGMGDTYWSEFVQKQPVSAMPIQTSSGPGDTYRYLTRNTSNYGNSIEVLGKKIDQMRSHRDFIYELRILTDLGPVNGSGNVMEREVNGLIAARLVLDNMVKHFNKVWASSNIVAILDARVARSSTRGMRHERYIFTDQVAMEAHRGVDITRFNSEKHIRDRVMRGFNWSFMDQEFGEAIPKRDGFKYDRSSGMPSLNADRVRLHFRSLEAATIAKFERMRSK